MNATPLFNHATPQPKDPKNICINPIMKNTTTYEYSLWYLSCWYYCCYCSCYSCGLYIVIQFSMYVSTHVFIENLHKMYTQKKVYIFFCSVHAVFCVIFYVFLLYFLLYLMNAFFKYWRLILVFCSEMGKTVVLWEFEFCIVFGWAWLWIYSD